MNQLKFVIFSLVFSTLIFSCSNSDDTVELPTVSTGSVSGIANTSAVSGGMVNNDGSSEVTARGVCWSVNISPTITDSKTTDGSGVGAFSSNITGLQANTTYYLRAYATNQEGTSYGNEVSFTTTNIPSPGSTREFVVDIMTVFGRMDHESGGYSCQDAKFAEFDMDPYAVSYTVHFYDMVITYPGQAPQPYAYPTLTYSFSADQGIEIKNGSGYGDGYTYTNWYSVGNAGAVTRDTPNQKLYTNATWCAGTGVCHGICNTFTGKARITVRY